MKRRTYTNEMVEFLSTNADKYTLVDLTKIFNIKFNRNKTLSAIESFVYQNKLRSSFTLTEEMKAFLRASPDYISHKELTARFNSNFNLNKEPYHIRYYCAQLGIKKANKMSEEMVDFLRDNFENISQEELTSRFNAKFSLNKTRNYISCYCSKYGLKKKNESRALPIGSETLRATSGGIYVKVAEGEWKAKHRLIWEQHNGPIPKGHYVIFADRNMENCNIENLELVTADELIYLSHSSLFHADEELTRIGINIAKISVKIRKHNKKKEKMQLVKKRRTRRKFDEYIYTGKSKLQTTI